MLLGFVKKSKNWILILPNLIWYPRTLWKGWVSSKSEILVAEVHGSPSIDTHIVGFCEEMKKGNPGHRRLGAHRLWKPQVRYFGNHSLSASPPKSEWPLLVTLYHALVDSFQLFDATQFSIHLKTYYLKHKVLRTASVKVIEALLKVVLCSIFVVCQSTLKWTKVTKMAAALRCGVIVSTQVSALIRKILFQKALF